MWLLTIVLLGPVALLVMAGLPPVLAAVLAVLAVVAMGAAAKRNP